MTNEEIIKRLKEMYTDGYYIEESQDAVESEEAIEIAINSIQENTKLKAEIEQLKLYAVELINARNLSEETAVSIQAKMQRELLLETENDKLKESGNYLSEVNENLVKANDKLNRKIKEFEERLEIKDNNFELYSNVLEEIERLKCDIEQSREENRLLHSDIHRVSEQNREFMRNDFHSFVELAEDNERLVKENYQLKSELEQSAKEKYEVMSKIEYALNECEPIYNKCAVIPQAKPVYDLAMNYCLDLLKGQV